MGMINEAIAKSQAKTYASMMFDAIAENNNDVIFFCKKHIYPQYLLECSEAWIDIDKNLAKFFDNVQNS